MWSIHLQLPEQGLPESWRLAAIQHPRKEFCSLYKAAELCKSWDEFYELNVLALYFYFPNPEWFSGVSSNFVQRSYIHMVSPILQSSGPAACYIACWHIYFVHRES
jgi:hypothetical protein